jgi:hypothetical protein
MKVKMRVVMITEVEAETSDEAFEITNKLLDKTLNDSWQLESIACLTDEVPDAEDSVFNQ